MKNLLVGLLLAITVASCTTDASVADYNLRKAADQFEVYRRVVFYNGITDSYILVIEGYCSIEAMGGQLRAIVKLKDGTYMKHNLGLSDNVTFFSEQLVSSTVNDDRYRVIFKPKAVIPTVELDK